MHAPIADGFRPRIMSNASSPASPPPTPCSSWRTRARPAVGRQRRARVEAEPAEPEHARAEHDERNVRRGVGRRRREHLRRPRTIAPASAANPADMCTTVPPAKSRTPHLRRKPVRVPGPVRERAVDEEAEEDHEEQVRRETHALGERPVMSAGVMIANFSWNSAKSISGMVGASAGCGRLADVVGT